MLLRLLVLALPMREGVVGPRLCACPPTPASLPPRPPPPQEFERGSLYGLEKFWAFHHYGGVPAEFDIELHPKLQVRLAGGAQALHGACA
jgi:hypothetical protein